jgi:hypothetical protein
VASEIPRGKAAAVETIEYAPVEQPLVVAELARRGEEKPQSCKATPPVAAAEPAAVPAVATQGEAEAVPTAKPKRVSAPRKKKAPAE